MANDDEDDDSEVNVLIVYGQFGFLILIIKLFIDYNSISPVFKSLPLTPFKSFKAKGTVQTRQN